MEFRKTFNSEVPNVTPFALFAGNTSGRLVKGRTEDER
jgi:hypothetical protein